MLHQSKKSIASRILIIIIFIHICHTTLTSAAEVTLKTASLNSRYYALIDGESGRLLSGKASDTEVPMASTTKIMTCYLALQLKPEDYVMTTSAYAASMPDVQLNAVKGEQFYLSDLLYSLMLKSHNDVAVVIAENYVFHYLCQNPSSLSSEPFSSFDLSFLTDEILASDDSSVLSTFSTEQSKILVKIFAHFMNTQAVSFGCTKTYYITPNGLDASDDNGVHRTTAYELALVMSECIKLSEFNKICQTKSHSFSDTTGRLTYSVSNANAFLDMYDNIIAGKTGFTGNAGYCYICAYQADGRTFIVSLLACGWPSNKSYKWKDTKLLLNYARENYFKKTVIDSRILSVPVLINQGDTEYAYVQSRDTYETLLSDTDKVNILYDVPVTAKAPVYANEQAGTAHIYINDQLVQDIPLTYCNTVKRLTFISKIIDIIEIYLFVS